MGGGCLAVEWGPGLGFLLLPASKSFPFLPGYIQKIKSGEEDFESLASQFSDCSSAKAGGDLGAFGRGECGSGLTPGCRAERPDPIPAAGGTGVKWGLWGSSGKWESSTPQE